MKNMKYYKVVRKDETGELYSFTIRRQHEKLLLSYKIGVRTVPDIGEIFIFAELTDAMDFGKQEDSIILAGDAEEVQDIKGCLPMLDDLCVYDDIFAFWEGKWSPLTTMNEWPTGRFQVPPVGTYVCKAFTPTEIVRDAHE